MEIQDHRKPNQSGHEGHGGAHVCHKCGWPFPNLHPSARHRRAHKRVCGTIEGYKLDDSKDKPHLDGSDDEQHASDDEHKTPSRKVVETTIIRKSSNGTGSRSSRSTRSEDDVFADAVTDFVDSPGLEETSDGVVRRVNSLQKITENDPDSTKLIAENAINDNSSTPNIHVEDNQLQAVQKLEVENGKTEGGMLSQDCISSSIDNSTPVSASVAIENENAVEQHVMQSSRTSSVLNLSVEEGKEASSKDLSEMISIATGLEAARHMSEDVSIFRDVSEERQDSVSADGMVKLAGMRTDGFEGKVECAHEGDSLVNVHASVDSAQVVDSVNGNTKSTGMIEEPDSEVYSNENMHVVAVPDALPLQEHPEIPVENLDHKGRKLNISMTPDATLAFASVAYSKDAAVEESYYSSDFAKPCESSGVCSQGGGIETVHSTEDVGKNNSIILHNTVGDAIQTSDAKACNIDIGEFKCKEVSEDINSETWKKEISSSEEQKSSFPSDKVLLEGAIVDGGDNAEAKSYASVGDKENFAVLEKDGSQAPVEGLAATSSTLAESAPVKKVINALDVNDMVDDGKVQVKGSALDVDRIVGDGSKAVSAETLPDSSEGNVEACKPDINSGNVIVVHSEPENLPSSEGVGEVQSTNGNMGGQEGMNENGTGAVVKTKDHIDSLSKTTQSGVSEVPEVVGSSFPHSTATGDSRPEKVAENASSAAEVDGITKDHVDVSAVDTLIDTNNQTDSVKGNWGSVSVLSVVSDAPPATNTAASNTAQTSPELVTAVREPKTHGKGPNFESEKSIEPQVAGLEQKEGASEIHTSQTQQLQNSALQTGWSPSVAHVENNQYARNRNEEVIAKVNNWDNEKQHTPLKTLLGEATARSPAELLSRDDNLIPHPQKEEIPTKNGLSSKTETVILRYEEATKEEIGKEWNSPARYPVNIKTEKRRAKSRPYWAPFLCCSSVNAAR